MNKNVDSAKKVDVSKILGKYGVYIALLVLFSNVICFKLISYSNKLI